jgi:protein-S-isoprenylcysteine O-methyltransferase Ste14
MEPTAGATLPERRAYTTAAWIFYAVVVLEILYMISPAALYFYAGYGPGLNALRTRPATAWLTTFFLPHFSRTSSPVLNALPVVAWVLILAGLLVFAVAFVQVYAAKLRGRGPVTGGLYAFVRHPQYAALAGLGLGTALIWPRFIVLLAYTTMLFLYGMLAAAEEERCRARFGAPYAEYLGRTGRFLPRGIEALWPRLLPSRPAARRVALALGYVGALVGVVLAGRALQAYALSTVAARFADEVAVLSPAPLSADELGAAYRLARAADGAGGRRIVYVVPEEWHLPDLPLEAWWTDPARAGRGGHRTPSRFDRTRYKVLFARPRLHDPEARGRDLVRSAHGLDPVVVAHVDLAAGRLLGTEAPPAHVVWGDIPTPLF